MALLRHNPKSRATCFKGNPASRPNLCNPAISLRPVAFRPLLTKGLALLWNKLFFDDNELIHKYAPIIYIGLFKINFRKIFAIQDFF
jgi:hypothetical protein